MYKWIPRRFVHKKTGRPTPNNFKDVDHDGVSVEWEKYSDANACKSHSLEPEDVGVVQLVTGAVRQIDLLAVEHRPLPERKGHAVILGRNLDRDAKQAKVELVNICIWAVDPPTA